MRVVVFRAEGELPHVWGTPRSDGCRRLWHDAHANDRAERDNCRRERDPRLRQEVSEAIQAISGRNGIAESRQRLREDANRRSQANGEGNRGKEETARKSTKGNETAHRGRRRGTGRSRGRSG